MVRKLQGEQWKQLQFSGWRALRKQYAVSNLGRCASFVHNLEEDGKILKGSLTTGYRTLNLHRGNHKGTLYLHREIAKLFIKKPTVRHKYVLHLNFDKTDNKITNLKWATLEEMVGHQQQSPKKIAYKQHQRLKSATQKGLKLTPSQVRTLKKIINDPKRKLTYKQLAKKYNVSEMTIYRIKSGENWSAVQ